MTTKLASYLASHLASHFGSYSPSDPASGFGASRPGSRSAKRFGKRAVFLCVLALSGCMTVGPDFKTPQVSAPKTWLGVRSPVDDSASQPTKPDASVHFDPEASPDPRWWRAFHDPVLDELISRAVAGNLDLQQAVLRIAASRSQEQIARAAGLPSVNATAAYTRQQLGLQGILQEEGAYSGVDSLGAPGAALNQFAPGTGTQVSQAGRKALDGFTSPTNFYQAGFDASWELDLFGRVRRSVEAANAQAQAQVEQRNDALVSLEAEVARTYAQLRGAQVGQRVTRELVDSERNVLLLTQSQQKTGLASEIDVQSARARLATSQADLPQYGQQIAQALNALSVLVGEAPGALDALLVAPGEIPSAASSTGSATDLSASASASTSDAMPSDAPALAAVPIGLPSALLRRRPDIRQAEAQLHAATAQVGVATAQLFPDVSLTGSFGYRSLQASDIGNWANHFYSFGPAISLPIFQGGQIVANIRMSKADEAAAALNYRKTVLSALADVDNAMAAYQSDHDKRLALATSVAASDTSLQISTNGYRHGLTSFITVLNAQTTLAQNRTALVAATLSETTDLVALYKALGGGWQDASGNTVSAPVVGTLGNAGMRSSASQQAN